jgi:WD40 repeat protein
VVARNERPGGASDGGLAVPLAVFRDAFPEQGEALLRRNTVERHPGFTATPKPRGRSDWSWPGGAWDFGPYRKERRQGFVGRDWLLQKVRAWAADPEAKQALLIGADFGVGKTAFLAKLLDHEDEAKIQIEAEAENQGVGVRDVGPGLPVMAQHFCNSEVNAYLSPGRFVQSLAAQLKEELPAFRMALEDDGAISLRECLNQAEAEPLLAFQQAVVAPLAKIPAPATRRLLVVDALDEALDYQPVAGGARSTIVDLLAKEARNLPPWLRVLATSRRRPEVLDPLRQGFFSIEEINAEEDDNLDDIRAYAEARCQQEPLAALLARAGLGASETARELTTKSGGKFLYAVRVLNDLASGALKLKNRQSLDALPPGIDGFYEAAFERRFPEEARYTAVQPILALLCEQREPLGCQSLGVILGRSARQVSTALQPLKDLLRLIPAATMEGSDRGDVFCSFDHLSLKQWLSEEIDYQRRAGRFGVDREKAAAQIHTWGLAEVEAGRAHTSPYLVRHLASHLTDDERQMVITGQLRQFPWLQARLRLAGLNALLADFDPPADGPASLPPELQRLGCALRQAAHVLTHQEGWNGQEQLASQLLARLAVDAGLEGMRDQATAWLLETGNALPRAASLLGQEALLRTLPVRDGVKAVVTLPDGLMACGCSDGTIRIWDPASGCCTNVLEGHQSSVKALTVLRDGRLASGSNDNTIRIWDPSNGFCINVLAGHQRWVNDLAVLGDGRLASGSEDNTVRIWDPASGSCTNTLEGHWSAVVALAVLGDGRLASASCDRTIRIWDPVSGSCTNTLEGRHYSFRALAVLDHKRLVSASDDNTIRIWDPVSGSCTNVFEGHLNSVSTLAVLGDGRLASGSGDTTIRIWDANSGSCTNVLEGHQGGVFALAVLGDGRLASCSNDNTIRIWDPDNGSHTNLYEGQKGPVVALVVLENGHLVSSTIDSIVPAWDPAGSICLWDPDIGSCTDVFKGHQGYARALAVLGDGRLASESGDNTIRIWDPASGTCTNVLEGHQGGVNALAVLSDGRLASGSGDTTIRIWDPNSGSCTNVLEGHQGSVFALAVLGDGRLASCSNDNTIRIWDPNSGCCSNTIEGHQGWVRALAVLSNKHLVSASDDNTIRIWDPASGSCTNVYKAHQSSVFALVVLGDGRLASGSDDHTIRLWDPHQPNGAPRVVFVGDAGITALAWVPTHQLLVAGDASGRLHWLAMGPLKR